MNGSGTWSRGPNITIVSEAAWRASGEDLIRHALERTARDGVPTEIRVDTPEGRLLYHSPERTP